MTTTEPSIPTDFGNTVRPMHGEQYLDSLPDEREVYIFGERVDDVTRHPAFRNCAHSVARLYEAMHSPPAEGVLRVPTDTGNGGFTRPFFKTARSSGDLIASRGTIARSQRLAYGWMGRSPDYQAGLLGTYEVNSDYYGPFSENALRWYQDAQERLLYFNHALRTPTHRQDQTGRRSSRRLRARPTRDRLRKAFAEQCMSEYDIDGWTLPGVFNGEDLTITRNH